uniref:Cytokine receptor like factor 2 n=1 Tax=Suricata suricatta TaxID=37032 RepID=A0A673VS85_SURSU
MSETPDCPCIAERPRETRRGIVDHGARGGPRGPHQARPPSPETPDGVPHKHREPRTRTSLLLGGSPVCLFFPEGALQVQIINFNFEAVQVTWNRSEPPSGTNLTFFYTLSSDADGKQCPHYILQDDRTAGCVLEARKDEILCFSVGDGAAVLVQKCEWISAYLKPSSPRALTFRWHREAVTVSCSELPYKRLLYEVQFKSTFDTEWQVSAVTRVAARVTQNPHWSLRQTHGETQRRVLTFILRNFSWDHRESPVRDHKLQNICVIEYVGTSKDS